MDSEIKSIYQIMKKIAFILLFLPLAIFAQQDKADKAVLEKEARKFVRDGNELYNQLEFADAEVAYKKAIAKSSDYETAIYNLGNALSQQNRGKEAIEQYELVAKMSKDKMTIASSMHNIGNAHFQEKEYQKAVDSYKNSLRANPKDDETRYNLALAQEMLKNQQENQDDKKDDKDNKDNKDKDQENKDQDKKDDEKDEDEEEKKDDKKDEDKKDSKDDKKDDKKEQKPQPGKLSPQQIKQLLEAMNNEEKKTQEKMNAKKERGKKVKQEKDW